jgi:D-tyrosyl-tRNA(Tyr) deacylase
MKAVIQRVSKAKVNIINCSHPRKISKGLVVFLGIAPNDSRNDIMLLSQKILNLRIFTKNNKMELSIKDIKGSILLISQFTLYGDCTKGNRPSFINAAEPVHAKKIYNEFVTYMTNQDITIQTGNFGAHMEVALINDGPVTLILDTQKNEKK